MIKHKIIYSEYLDRDENGIKEFRHVEFRGSIEGCIKYMEAILSGLRMRANNQVVTEVEE